ncbi:uncharacterized protein LOC141726916 isoform X3 [Zonotrichia albicollis]|uniref:uncharacterized protein LOC141726916 isoform X3 n=1 Tax=Zonotrichia albicollis TaxID=44394 RepID=UPI003D8118E4
MFGLLSFCLVSTIMMEEIDRFQVPAVRAEMQPLDPTAASILDRDCGMRGETVAMNCKPSPLQVKLEKQRELAQKGFLKNGNMGSPVNQQPKKNNVMARTRSHEVVQVTSQVEKREMLHGGRILSLGKWRLEEEDHSQWDTEPAPDWDLGNTESLHFVASSSHSQCGGTNNRATTPRREFLNLSSFSEQ